MKGLKKYMAGILVAGMVLGSVAVPAPVYATEAEDVQEEWKKGTPLAPELLSAFEVLHSKEELEEKKIERKKEQA